MLLDQILLKVKAAGRHYSKLGIDQFRVKSDAQADLSKRLSITY